MSAEDYLPPAWYDSDEAREDRKRGWAPKEKRACKRCGTQGLHWVEYAVGEFALYKGGTRHVCSFASDFD